MELLYISIFFVVGAVFGSFLNVVIYRIPLKQSINYPASHCMECGTKLKVLDLIPIMSWIYLKGECRTCKCKVSMQYPLIELITGASFAIFYMLFSMTQETFVLCALTLFFIPLCVIDIKHQKLPNKIVLSLGVFALVMAIVNIYEPIFLYASDPLDPLYGALIGSGILFLVSMLGYVLYGKRQVMGMGDIKLLIAIGLLCGFQDTLWILLYSVVIAAVIGIVLFTSGKKTRKDTIAFGPFIITAFYIVILSPLLGGFIG